MFIAALFTIAKMWKQSKYPLTDEWIKKKWCVCVCVYNGIPLGHKKYGILSFAATWMNLQLIIVSELNQTKK